MNQYFLVERDEDENVIVKYGTDDYYLALDYCETYGGEVLEFEELIQILFNM